MTIDLGQTNIELHLDGIMPTSSGIRVTLTSNYSNEPLWNAIVVDSFTIYDEWYTLNITNNDYTDEAIEGYYTLLVERNQNGWLVYRSYLVKCTNSANSSLTPTSYQSDNEDNEQPIYFQ
jgi:hypothetical protein